MNRQIYEEAGEWFVDFRAGDVDAEARVRFDAWIRRSPEHVRAYLETAAIWNEGAQLDAAARFTPDGLRTAALAESNLVTLYPAPVPPVTHATIPVATRMRRFALAASVLVAIVGALFLARTFTTEETYQTAIGEQRSIVLADGSVIELNALSRVTVDLARDRRRVDLSAGQALFRVAPDAARPFVVFGDTAQVQAVGTEFDVKRRGDGAVVTVLKGRVSVGADAAVLLSAGEQVHISARRSTVPTAVDVSMATAWTQGRMVFDATPLAEVVEEFNRYNRRQLIVTDIGIPSISGAFSSTDPTSLVNYLRQRPGVVVTETPTEIRVSRSP